LISQVYSVIESSKNYHYTFYFFVKFITRLHLHIFSSFFRFLRFLQERSRKDKKSFGEFYNDYSAFLKEGIITTTEQYEREEISKLLRFESSTQPAGETVTIPEYCSRKSPSQLTLVYVQHLSINLSDTFEKVKIKIKMQFVVCFYF
jgi:HSP90 family molecular chaperone